MLKLKILLGLGMALVLSHPAMAQTTVSGPDQIQIPDGYTLVEIPAKFKIVNKPFEQKVGERKVIIPPIYRHFSENGIRKQVLVQREVIAAPVLQGPYLTRKIGKVIVRPVSYVLQDKNGRTVKRWQWIKGKLTEV